ncbi:lectin-like protein [Rubripirellula obstinata]|uniref:lectin-like protein n=1 Tax=Rubripirellula obstinata TaxID=406547 RepID=UPI00082D5E67|nr:lectin-like protein [Rubripirellula obstinata]
MSVEHLEARQLLASDLLQTSVFSGTLDGASARETLDIEIVAGQRLRILADQIDYAPDLFLRNPSGEVIRLGNDNNLDNSRPNLIDLQDLSDTGTYELAVEPNRGLFGDFQIRIDVGTDIQLEENPELEKINDDEGRFALIEDFVVFEDVDLANSTLRANVGGSIILGDKDNFGLGYFSAGTVVEVDASDIPEGSTLPPLVTVGSNVEPIVDTDPSPSVFRGTIPSDGYYSATIASASFRLNGKIYEYDPVHQGWEDARQAAIANGAELVSIESASLNQRIIQEFGDYWSSTWIGLQDIDQDDSYAWTDGEASVYRNWGNSEPSRSPFGAIDFSHKCFCFSRGDWITPARTSEIPSITERILGADDSDLTGSGFAATYAARIEIQDNVIPSIRSIAPELQGRSFSQGALDEVTIQLSKPFDENSLSESTFQVRTSGVDGQFGTADDIYTNALGTPQATNPFAVPEISVNLASATLSAGDYQLVVNGNITDRYGVGVDVDGDGVAGGTLIQQFSVLPSVGGQPTVTEIEPNNTFDQAVVLPIEADGVTGQWSRSAVGLGIVGDDDFWSLELLEGQSVIFGVERDGGGSFDPTVALFRHDGSNLVGLGTGFTQEQFQVQETGTYFARVRPVFSSEQYTYRLSALIHEDAILENESGGTQSIAPEQVGDQTFESVVGETFAEEDDVDAFEFPNLNPGDTFRLEILPNPHWSGAIPTFVPINETAGLVDTNPAENIFEATVTQSTALEFEFSQQESGAGVREGSNEYQYSFRVTIVDGSGPTLTLDDEESDHLGVYRDLIAELFYDFSEPILSDSLTSENATLLYAGPDNNFGTLDDRWIEITAEIQSANQFDGPRLHVDIEQEYLEDGYYRFVVEDSVTDLAGNLLDGDGNQLIGGIFVDAFQVAALLPGEIGEGIDNDKIENATALPVFQSADSKWSQTPVIVANQSSGNNDWFSFQAEAGQQLRLLGDFAGLFTFFYEDENGVNQFFRNTSSRIIDLTRTATYRFRSRSDIPGESRLSIALSDPDLDFASSTVESLNFSPSGGLRQAVITGISETATSQDRLNLGTLAAGEQVQIVVNNSPLSQANLRVDLVDSTGQVVADLDPENLSLSAEIPADGQYEAIVSVDSVIFDNRQFELTDLSYFYPEVLDVVAADGKFLATVDSPELNVILADQYAGSAGKWIGLDHTANPPRWHDGQEVDFANGFDIENADPLSGIRILNTGQWFSSSNQRPGITQRPLDPEDPDFAINSLASLYDATISIAGGSLFSIADAGSIQDGDTLNEMFLGDTIRFDTPAFAGSLSEDVVKLVGAGADGILDTADDQEYDLSIELIDGATALRYQLANEPLSVGLHRFTLTSLLTDESGTPIDGNQDEFPGGELVRTFTFAGAPEGFLFGTSENIDADNAIRLTIHDDPGGQDIARSEIAVSFAADEDDEDWWVFSAEQGQSISVRFERPTNNQADVVIFRQEPGGELTRIFDALNNEFSTGLLSFIADQDADYFIRSSMNPPPGQLDAIVPDSLKLAVLVSDTLPIGPFADRSTVEDQIDQSQGTFQYVATVEQFTTAAQSPRLGWFEPGTVIVAEITGAPDWSGAAPRIFADGAGLVDTDPSPSRFQGTTTDQGIVEIEIRQDAGESGFDAQVVVSGTISETILPEVFGFSGVPAEGATSTNKISELKIEFNEEIVSELLPSDAIVIQHAGADQTFGTADDYNYDFDLVSSLESLNIHSPLQQHFVTASIHDGFLLPGANRIVITDALFDRVGNLIEAQEDAASFGDQRIAAQRSFNVADIRGDVVPETIGDFDPIDGAFLPLIEDRDGTAWSRSQIGSGRIDPDFGPDWWQFDGQAGDVADIFVSHDSATLNQRPSVEVYFDPSGTGQLASLQEIAIPFVSGNSNHNIRLIRELELTETGTYFVLVDGIRSIAYDIEIATFGGGQLESESSSNEAQEILFNEETGTPEVRRGRISATAYAPSANVDEDRFGLSAITAGSSVIATLNRPEWSFANLRIELRDSAGTVLESTTYVASNYIQTSVPADGNYELLVTAEAGDGVQAQYDLSVLIADTPNDVPQSVEIESVSINGNSATRSAIETIEITFDSVIDLGLSQIQLISVDTGVRVRGLRIASEINDGKTTAILSFESGTGIVDSQSSVPSKLQSDSYTIEFRGDGYIPTSRDADDFFAKYGDTDGNGDVNLSDFATFRSGFGLDVGDNGFRSDLDDNRDGVVGLVDFAAFRNSFGRP